MRVMSDKINLNTQTFAVRWTKRKTTIHYSKQQCFNWFLTTLNTSLIIHRGLNRLVHLLLLHVKLLREVHGSHLQYTLRSFVLSQCYFLLARFTC